MKENTKRKIWFIRHAQSLTNADTNIKSDDFGGGSVSLSELGLKQAEDLASIFLIPPDLLITSFYVRTKQTAAPLIKKFPGILQEEWKIHEFTYLSKEKCFNTTFSERRVWRDKFWQKADPMYCDGEGAESFTDFMNRLEDAIEKLKKSRGKFVVLFSHEYVILAVKYLLEKKPKKITHKEMKDFRDYCLLNKIPNIGKLEIKF